MMIQQIFEEQVKKTPDNIAVAFDHKSLTYEQLNRKANQLARTLRKKGVKPDTIVPIMISRSLDIFVGILGILKAGGAYLPIDPTYPANRIDYMLQDVNANILLTHTAVQQIKGFEGEVINIDSGTINDEQDSNIDCVNQNTDLIYAIYTSGSSGKPKGVLIEHKAICNFIEGVSERIDFSEGKTIVSMTTIAFDIFILESILPLTRGLKILISDPWRFADSVKTERIDMLQATPSKMRILLDAPENIIFLRELKEIMIGGEEFPPKLLAELKRISKAQIYNMYGPTETAVWSLIKNLTDTEIITIGTPIKDTQAIIINEDNGIISDETAGELCIGGSGVARGYYNRPDLTAEKFIQYPYAAGARMYRTGDLVRRLQNGELEFLGRLDDQIKLRGYRIELSEIKENLNKYCDIKECIITVQDNKNGEKGIAAFYVSDKALDADKLSAFLSMNLPDYMIPRSYIRLEEVPLLPNGKLNKKALELIYHSFMTKEADFSMPTTENERKLAEIWKKILGLDHIPLEKSFLELGGSSITAGKMLIELKKSFGDIFNLTDLYLYPTIREIAKHIEIKSSLRHNKLENQSTRPAEGKKLDRIIPFNEAYYRNCFYSSFIPIMDYYQKDIAFLLANDIGVYSFNDGKQWEQLKINYIHEAPFEHLMETIGIYMEQKNISTDILNDICSAIDKGRPAIIWIDSYYNPARKDTYQKRHMGHSWLVYGYHHGAGQVNIIEHKHRDSLTYSCMEVKYSVLKECYSSYISSYKRACGIPGDEGCSKDCGYPHQQNYLHKCKYVNQLNFSESYDYPTFYEFYDSAAKNGWALQKSESQKLCIAQYKKLLMKNLDALYGGVGTIQAFIMQIRDIIGSEQQMTVHAQTIQNVLVEITSNKQTERYKLQKIWGGSNAAFETLDRLIDIWNYVRTVIMKFNYSKVYDNRTMQETAKKLEEIALLEKSYIEQLLNLPGGRS